MGELRNSFKMLVGKPEGKRSLVRSGYRWEASIEMYLK
jgi:hypothetical protein